MTISVEQFVEFLDSFKEDYLNTIYEISKPRADNNSNLCRIESDEDPLIRSSIKMLDFDTICCESPFFQRNNRPSTVDALYYRINQEGKLILYLIEFKGSNLNWDNERSFTNLDIYEGVIELFIKEIFNENDILEYDEVLESHYSEIHSRIKHLCDTNMNKIEVSLRLKAFESIFVVLPSIYKEYYEKKDSSAYISTVDVLEFFESSSCEIQLLVVGKKYYNNKYKDNGKLLYNKVHKQYARLKYYAPYTIGYYKLFNRHGFYRFLDELGEEGDLKTLND